VECLLSPLRKFGFAGSNTVEVDLALLVEVTLASLEASWLQLIWLRWEHTGSGGYGFA